jgi:hypothetical protein
MVVFDTLGMGLFCQNPLLIQSLKISIVLLVISVISLLMAPSEKSHLKKKNMKKNS